MAGQIDQAATCRDGLQVRGTLRNAGAVYSPSSVGQHFVEAVGRVKAMAADTPKGCKRRAA